ncbi:MAG: Rpp14/Pop5 family protein [Candidatus Nanoarchaeia archaeon]|nr:Rpp14/Pop5 family protein [Candidatus Nanoarchaeia archaeon]MDD5588400.1 Rpp14/Pop5 family protein [Candidatus Nanoarchaeia archaeon]
MKLKALMPSLREKKRYVAFEVISESPINKASAENTIMETYKEYYGKFGLAKANLIMLEDWKTQNNTSKGIMFVNNKYTDALKSCFSLIKEINNKKVIVKCLGVSGILKKAKFRYLN